MILMVLAATMVGAQDLTHYKRVIKELSSAKYQGRGYAKDGANKAGRFLQQEFEKGDAFQYYHTIFDTYKTVRFDSYEPVFRLVRDFIEQY